MLDILMASLEGVGPVEVFTSGAACLQRVGDCKPDLFVLDVSMPEMDGYTLCRHLKDDWETQDIPVIFMSASDDGHTRLACYEAGGDDFIQKPFEAAELLSKVKVVGRTLEEKAALREQAGYAQRTAMSAMVSMGELGVVLQFLSRSFACQDAEELAAAILEAMQSYDLDTAVQLRVLGEPLSLSRNGRNLPFEVSVLNHVSQSDRIFQFKSRCAFNYGHVTLLVNNMPLDDAERAGRIRDNVALLAEGADARVKAIETDLIAQRRRSGIESALPTLYTTLDAVQTNYRRNCFELTQVMIDFQEALTKAFVHLGLTESQEEEVTNLANQFMARVVGTQDASLHIVGDLERLADNLKELLRH
ncbi:response regulator [Azonexus sp. IMCC34839]|uniref:response regulator n=1 Tax=Azonexus sp. IMCC34839 TaxID=3133695 RepID=UPI003999533D